MVQGYGGRDQATAIYYEKLLDAGVVEEEIQLYGCAYLDGGEIGYFITEKEQKIFRFILQCEQNNIYCTTITTQTYWHKFAKGERQYVKRQDQFQLLQVLQQQYSTVFFEVIAELEKIPVSNDAELILNEWKRELDSCGDVDLLCLFESTVSFAMQRKVLKADSGSKYLSWVQQLKHQMERDQLLEDGAKHTYVGFGYVGEAGKLQYMQFTKQHTAWQQQQQLMLQGYLVSPLLSKDYYFDAVDFRLLQQKKQTFDQCLRHAINDVYIERYQEIYSLRLPECIEPYKALKTKIAQLSEEEQRAIQLYGVCLGML